MWAVTAASPAAIGWNVRADKYEANVQTYAFKAAGQKKPSLTKGIDIVREYLEGTAGKQGGWTRGRGVCGFNSTACHATLKYDGLNMDVAFTRIGGFGQGSFYATADNTRPQARAFFAWMFGPESPWRSITKDFNADIDWAIKRGVVVGGVNKMPPNLAYNFFIVTRFPGEFQPTCDWWYSLVERGVAPWYAFYLCHIASPERLAYTGAHGGLNFPDPRNLRDATPGRLHEPGGFATPASAVWDWHSGDPIGAIPPAIWGSFEVEVKNTITGETTKQSQRRFNPDFEALVAACLEEQERIGTTSKENAAA